MTAYLIVSAILIKSAAVFCIIKHLRLYLCLNENLPQYQLKRIESFIPQIDQSVKILIPVINTIIKYHYRNNSLGKGQDYANKNWVLLHPSILEASRSSSGILA
jgi:hypothetical protein